MNAVNSPSHETANLALYYSETCWFCARVRQTIKELGLSLELRDIDVDRNRRTELIDGGGKGQVPCLRIAHPNQPIEWMYESSDIVAYLSSRFKPAPASA